MSPEANRPVLVHRTTCRVCGGTDLEQILSLGTTPLANAFLSSADEFVQEESYPLNLYFCGQCSLLQLLDVVNPEVLFRHYLYVTGTSTTMADHNVAYARTLADLLDLSPSDLVAEVASNDGSLLRCFAALGVRTVGIEPARNLAARAQSSGIDTVNEFFTHATAQLVCGTHGRARAVVANNVLAHVDDPGGFLRGCRELVTEDGLITIEVPYVGDLVDRLEYDTVYHEHLSYFSISALLKLCDRVDLRMVRIDRLPVHGGTMRVYLSRAVEAHAAPVRALEADERRAGLASVGRYRRFAEDVRRSRAALVELLEHLATEGRRVVGYGAPAKGNTLLNYCGIDTRLIAFTVDKNPMKVGLFTPGSHLPVRPVDALVAGADVPDYVLILAWNFADEIMQQQQAYRDRGGRFIVPGPEPRVV